ncbi:MAG: CPBP family intramembrane glutamic endopeptidase [Myxococcota bacterium]
MMRWLLPISALVWLISFAVVVHLQSWLLLVGVGPTLAALRLTLDPSARTLLRPNLRLVALGVIGALVMIAATYLVYALASSWLPWLAPATSRLYGLLGKTAQDGGITLVALLSVVVVSEEVIFRSEVPPLRAWWRETLVASLIYALAHITSQDILLVSVAFLCGLIWTALRLLTRSLVPSLLVHLAWDLAVLVVQPLAP